MENQEGRYLYVLDKEGLPRMTYIRTNGQTSDGMWIISEGVKPGDKIVTSGLQKVIPGKPVRIISAVSEEQQLKKENIFTKWFNKK